MKELTKQQVNEIDFNEVNWVETRIPMIVCFKRDELSKDKNINTCRGKER